MILSFNCSSQEKISNNRTFKKVFTESELKDAEIIFEFFNHSICEDFENLSLDSCYGKFLKELIKKEALGHIELDISFVRQQAMYEKLDSATFFNFWQFDKMGLSRERIDTLKSMTYNYDGSYVKFLRKVSKRNKAVKYYLSGFEMSGDVSPTMTASILMKYDHYKINDIRVKFILAMHYLTLNDLWFRREKY